MAEEEKISIIPSYEAKRQFIQLRNKIEKLIENAPIKKLDEIFAEELSKIITEAVEGNAICQDYLGYIFKRGKPDLVPENIELSMKWMILAAANGNDFSIDRLAIFLNYAYDEIVYQPDFGQMKELNNIDEYNYTYIIGRLICDCIVDDLKINVFDLIKEVPDVLEFNNFSMRTFDLSRDKAIKIVLRYLRGYSPKDESGDITPEIDTIEEVNSSLKEKREENEVNSTLKNKKEKGKPQAKQEKTNKKETVAKENEEKKKTDLTNVFKKKDKKNDKK